MQHSFLAKGHKVSLTFTPSGKVAFRTFARHATARVPNYPKPLKVPNQNRLWMESLYVQYFHYRFIASDFVFSHDSLPATSCNLEPFNKKYSVANPKQFETATWSFTVWDETLTARLWDFFRIFTLPNPLRSQATGDRCLNSPLSWTHHTNTNKHQQKHWLNDITCIPCCVPNTLNSWSQGFSVLSLYQNLPISSDPGESHGDSSVGLFHCRYQKVGLFSQSPQRRKRSHGEALDPPNPSPNWNYSFGGVNG